MPLVERSTYQPPAYLRNPHAQMITASVLRDPGPLLYERQRLELPDGDFIALDWSTVGGSRLAAILHGLESCSHAAYVRGVVHALNRRGWDCVVINARGCSGEPNRLLRAYHSGETADPHAALEHIRAMRDYDAVALLGFSLGGNVALRYAGEHGRELINRIAAVAAVSVPCDLVSCARKLDQPGNRIYTHRFLRTLLQKVRDKQHRFPGAMDFEHILTARTFAEFDGRFTAPVHGFRDAVDYWHCCSSIHVMADTAVPTLLINAADDPFLTEECRPAGLARVSRHLLLEAPAHGSHVSFVPRGGGREYWHETRLCEFLDQHAPA